LVLQGAENPREKKGKREDYGAKGLVECRGHSKGPAMENGTTVEGHISIYVRSQEEGKDNFT